MEFTPQNPRQQEAYEFATNLSNLLNEGIEKGFLDRVYAQNYAVRESLINLSTGSPNKVYAVEFEILKIK